MNSWNYKALTFLSFVLLVNGAYALPLNWELPPGGEQEYQKASSDKVHQVLLSAPKRVNNALRIELSEKLKGEAESFLVRVDETSSSLDLFKYLEGLIEQQGEVLYRCEQRACGGSNYWANTILKERKLYGRDNDQYYLAGKVQQGSSDYWVSVYAVKNGRKQHYVLVNSVRTNGADDKASLNGENSPNGIVITSEGLAQDVLSAVVSHLDSNPDLKVWLSAEISAMPGESVSALDAKTSAALEAFKPVFVKKNGISAERVALSSQGGFTAANQAESQEVVFRLYLFAP